jgi:hypothetical protein
MIHPSLLLPFLVSLPGAAATQGDPYVDYVALPSGFPTSADEILAGDFDGDQEPDLVVRAGGSLLLVQSAATLGVLMNVGGSVNDVCVAPWACGGPDRLAIVTSSGLMIGTYNPSIGLVLYEAVLGGSWANALRVSARANPLDPERTDYLGVGADGHTVLLATEDPFGVTATGQFQVGTQIAEAFLLDWDGDPETGPEVGLLTGFGLQVHMPSGTALRRIRAPGPGVGIARVHQGSGADEIAWLADVTSAGGSDRDLYLFGVDGSSYEGPLELEPIEAIGTLVDDLRSGDFDGDGDDDLLVQRVGESTVLRLENRAEELGDSFTYLTTNGPLDDYVVPFDLAQDIPSVTDAGPLAWAPLYGEALPGTTNDAPVLDFAAFVVVDEEPRIRLLSGNVPPIRSGDLTTQPVNPFNFITTRSEQYDAGHAVPPYENDSVLDIELDITDVWLNDSLGNAFEVNVWRQQADLEPNPPTMFPYPDQLASAHFVFITGANDDGHHYALRPLPTFESAEWFPHAYFITLRRIQFDASTNTIVHGWRTYVAGLAMEDCVDADTLGWLQQLDDAIDGTIFLANQAAVTSCPAMLAVFASPSAGAGSVPQVRLPPPNPYAPPSLGPLHVINLTQQ